MSYKDLLGRFKEKTLELKEKNRFRMSAYSDETQLRGSNYS